MKYRSLVFAGAALQIGLAHGIGLGGIHVQSSLGTPLRANIEVSSSDLFSESDFKVKLANRNTYQQLGARYEASHGSIKFDVVDDGQGGWRVNLQTSQSMVEPFLDIVIELSWVNGSVSRRYNLLLDPPGYWNRASQEQPNPLVAERPVLSKPLKNSNRLALTAKTDYSFTHLYRVQSGDSLWSISSQIDLPNRTLSDKMDIIYQSNSHAFVSNDRNRLKLGVDLSLPADIPNEMDRSEPDAVVNPVVVDGNIQVIEENNDNIESELNLLKQKLRHLEVERKELLINKELVLEKILGLKQKTHIEILSIDATKLRDVNSEKSVISVIKNDELITPIALMTVEAMPPILTTQFDNEVKLFLSVINREWWIMAGFIPIGFMLYSLRRGAKKYEDKSVMPISEDELYDVVFGDKRNRNIPESPQQIQTAIGKIKEKAIQYELQKESENQEVALCIDDVKKMIELYLAHGQYERSVEILQMEIARYQNRKDLKLMLMSLYFQMRDWERFNDEMNVAMEIGDHLFIEQVKAMKNRQSTLNYSFHFKYSA